MAYTRWLTAGQKEIVAELHAMGFSFKKEYPYRNNPDYRGLILQGFWTRCSPYLDRMMMVKVLHNGKIHREEDYHGITKLDYFCREDAKQVISDLDPDVLTAPTHKMAQGYIGNTKTPISFAVPVGVEGYTRLSIGSTWQFDLTLEDMDKLEAVFKEANAFLDPRRMEKLL